MDKSVKPGDDFFAYANGNWVKNTEIPADRSSIGGFYIADQQREKNSVELFDAHPRSRTPRPTATRAASPIITTPISTPPRSTAPGMAPAKADLDAIAAIADKRALVGGDRRRRCAPTPIRSTRPISSTDNLFGIFVTQGLSTPGETLPYLMQGGLGMPEREYYLAARRRDGRRCATKYQHLCRQR